MKKELKTLEEAYTSIYEVAPTTGGADTADAISQNIQSGISTELSNYFKQFGQKLASANVKVDPGVLTTAMQTINKAVQASFLKNKKPVVQTPGATTPGVPSATPTGTPQQSI